MLTFPSHRDKFPFSLLSLGEPRDTFYCPMNQDTWTSRQLSSHENRTFPRWLLCPLGVTRATPELSLGSQWRTSLVTSSPELSLPACTHILRVRQPWSPLTGLWSLPRPRLCPQVSLALWDWVSWGRSSETGGGCEFAMLLGHTPELTARWGVRLQLSTPPSPRHPKAPSLLG